MQTLNYFLILARYARHLLYQETGVNKLIGTLGFLGVVMIFRETAKAVMITAADPFHAQGTVWGRFALWAHRCIVAVEADFIDYALLAAGAGAFAFLFGWLSHKMLHERGFGTLVNLAVGASGAAAGVIYYCRFGGDMSFDNFGALAVAAIAGSVAALGIAALIKPVVADRKADRADPRAQERLKRVVTHK